jgi:hypothetical protein
VLASSSKTQHIETFLHLIDGKSLADAWTTSDDVAKSKPEPDMVAAALAKVEGASAILIGDSVFDAQAAARAQDPHSRSPHRWLLCGGTPRGGRHAGLRLARGVPPGTGWHPVGPRQAMTRVVLAARASHRPRTAASRHDSRSGACANVEL